MAETKKTGDKPIEEIWKDIEGYEGLYQVSNLGNVRSLNYNKTGQTQILRPGTNNHGYLHVSLHKKGKQTTRVIHRLVAEAFVPNPSGLPQINHKSEDKTDNRAENLEWCSCSYNNNYGTRSARMASTQLNHPTKSKRVLCVETGTVYPSTKEAWRQTGINHHNIATACRKDPRQKTAGGFHWEYVTS